MREMAKNQRNALSSHNVPVCVCVLTVHIKRSEMTFFFSLEMNSRLKLLLLNNIVNRAVHAKSAFAEREKAYSVIFRHSIQTFCLLSHWFRFGLFVFFHFFFKSNTLWQFLLVAILRSYGHKFAIK